MTNSQSGPQELQVDDIAQAQVVDKGGGSLIQLAHAELTQGDFTLLAGFLADDSSSIRTYGNAPSVVAGYNKMLDDFTEASGSIEFWGMRLNEGELAPFAPPAKAPRLSEANYHPVYGTPLFDSSIDFLLRMDQELEERRKRGQNVAAMSVIFTDGENTCASTKGGSSAVNNQVTRMFATKRHIVMGMGVKGAVDFYQIFREMGIPERFIQVVPRSEVGLQQGFQASSDTTVFSARDFGSFTETSRTGYRPTQP